MRAACTLQLLREDFSEMARVEQPGFTKIRLPDLFGAIQLEVLLTRLHARTDSVRRSRADAFNPMRFVNDISGQVQLLIVYGNRQVVKSSGEM